MPSATMMVVTAPWSSPLAIGSFFGCSIGRHSLGCRASAPN
jgi:hypothetical protein